MDVGNNFLLNVRIQNYLSLVDFVVQTKSFSLSNSNMTKGLQRLSSVQCPPPFVTLSLS